MKSTDWKKTILIIVGVWGSFGLFYLFSKMQETPGTAPKSQTVTADVNTASSISVKELVMTLPIKSEGNNLYLSVSNFNVSNGSDVKALCAQVREGGYALKWPSTVHVLDNMPDFYPPSQGLYGSEEVQDKVVLQVSFLKNGTKMIYWDPFGTGRYNPTISTERLFD